jgi:hypothetical protein
VLARTQGGRGFPQTNRPRVPRFAPQALRKFACLDETGNPVNLVW